MKEAASRKYVPGHIAFMDNIRVIAMLFVVLYHSVIMYSTVTRHVKIHDDPTMVADYVRLLVDVFVMPVFFFMAGFFAVQSLEKKGTGKFLTGKLKRLGVPWLLVMISIMPLMVWGSRLGYYFSNKKIFSFSELLIEMLKFTIWSGTAGQPLEQFHLWFLSLLIVMFILFACVYSVKNRFSQFRVIHTSGRPGLVFLIMFSVCIALAGFVVILYFPKVNDWFYVGFIKFEPAKLPANLGYFLLGIYAYSRNWFSEGRIINSAVPWYIICLVTLPLYIITGMPVLSANIIPQQYTYIDILVYSLARSLLCMSVFIILVQTVQRYWNTGSKAVRSFAQNSFYIYIIHVFVVTGLQQSLLNWTTGSTLLKIVIVFTVSVVLSYLLSRFLAQKFPRITAGMLIAMSIMLVVMLNPHHYEKAFLRQQERISQNIIFNRMDYKTLREKAVDLFQKALADPDTYNEPAFYALSSIHHKNKKDFEIMAYLGRITVIIGDSKNLLQHMVHDVIGFTWLDNAAANAPGNFNIRLTRALDSLQRPNVFSDRWKYAETDLNYCYTQIADGPHNFSKETKTRVLSGLAAVYKKNKDTVQYARFKKRLAELEYQN